MNKLTAEKCREQFEEWYSKMKGTPLSVLMVLRDGDNYKETDGDRLDISWLAWQASREAIPTLEQQERGEEGDIISTPQYVRDEKWKSHFGLNQQPPAKPQDSRGEWIEWNGGECPTAKVEVKYRNGHLRTENAGGFRWYHLHNDFDIIAYRIIPERATNQNGEQ